MSQIDNLRLKKESWAQMKALRVSCSDLDLWHRARALLKADIQGAVRLPENVGAAALEKGLHTDFQLFLPITQPLGQPARKKEKQR